MNQLVRFLIQAGPERTRRGATMMGWISTGLVLLVVRLFQASDPELCRRPTIQYCVFLEHANVTCHWEPVGQPFSTTYTLQVNITSSLGGRTFKALEPCVTTETHCSVNIESVIHEYSMDVLARNSHGVSRSPRHDVYGLNEVKLYPPTFTNLARVPGKPKCLDLSWGRPQSFALSKPEVERGCLIFQLEFYSSGENHSQVIERNISGFDIELCIFRPGTEYRVRMRYQYINANRHWSDWTTYQSSSTDEAAPSAAPQAWWLIGSSDERGWRDFTLMWKPLPASVANGYVLWYKVQCWQDQDQDGHDVENCGTVNHSSYSCKLSLPPESCTCSLTASNSAGTSPEANVRIPASIESTGSTMSLSGLHVIPLDDHRMEVTWTVYDTRTDQTGFIIQWFPVSQGQMDNLYWEWQNPAARGLVITDGIHPEVPYDVSVRELHGATAGLQLSVVVFTRQGEPSAGPALQVQELGEGSVTLQWQQLKIAELRGFLRNYTLTYINANGQAKYVTLPGTFTQYTLRGLSGEYRVYITAHTDAGASPGPSVTVLVDKAGYLAVAILWCTLTPVFTILIGYMCLRLNVRIKRFLCSKVPDPSKSTLSTWIPNIPQQDDLKNVNGTVDSVSHIKLITYINTELCSQDVLQPVNTEICFHSIHQSPVGSEQGDHMMLSSSFSSKHGSWTIHQPLLGETHLHSLHRPSTKCCSCKVTGPAFHYNNIPHAHVTEVEESISYNTNTLDYALDGPMLAYVESCHCIYTEYVSSAFLPTKKQLNAGIKEEEWSACEDFPNV